MFGKKKKTAAQPAKTYDEKLYKAAMRCSICTGEQVAGFKNRETGKFEEVALIRNEAELQAFKDTYGVTDIEKFY